MATNQNKNKLWYEDWSTTRVPSVKGNHERLILHLPYAENHKEVIIPMAGIETVTVFNLLETALLELSKK